MRASIVVALSILKRAGRRGKVLLQWPNVLAPALNLIRHAVMSLFRWQSFHVPACKVFELDIKRSRTRVNSSLVCDRAEYCNVSA